MTKSPTTILLIDDESHNIEIVQTDLEDEGYRLYTAADGAEGWEVLQAHKEEIEAILLDRMMPEMDGMEFMKRLQADESVKDIPVIMQTAAAERQQIIEGIEAGVYYYLTKPYQLDMLTSILRAALRDAKNYQSLASELVELRGNLALVKETTIEVINLDDARNLSAFLAHHFPEPDKVSLGIWELLLNALEHGAADIGYNEKTALLEQGRWEEEIRQRLDQAQEKHQKVSIHLTRHPERISLTIRDPGDGFDWRRYMAIDPDRATHSHGRGIALANLMSFDRVEYAGQGNEVICEVAL